jgi:Tol biopolymer transport system component
MAPEQLQGLPADTRTDLFAFGALLYEMAGGRKAFEGPSAASVLARILESEPPPLTTIAPDVPPALDYIVRACLRKNRVERWQDVHDILVQLQWIEQQSGQVEAPTVTRRSARREWVAWTLAAVALAVAAFTMLRPARGVLQPAPSRTEVLLPARLWLHEWGDYPAISPDGRIIAFAGVVDGVRRLYLRPVNASTPQPVPNTEGAFAPFWSTDGRSVGFFEGRSIRRMDVDGGRVVTLGSYPVRGIGAMRRGTMNAAGVVLFADGGKIWRAGEQVATPVADKAPASAGAQTAPRFLADGERFIYFVEGVKAAIYVGSLATGEIARVGDISGPAEYVAGHLLYTHGRTLMARPVDPASLQPRGSDFPVADRVVASHFSAARNGTIVIRPADSELSRLAWFDRSGARQGTLGEPGEYRHVALSATGRRVAVAQGDPYDMDLWTADTATGLFTRVTGTPGTESDPTWSPDERSLAYSYIPRVASASPAQRRAVRRLDLTTGNDRELANDTCQFVDDWTRDGRVLCRAPTAMFLVPASRPDDLANIPGDGNGDQWHVSPDGKWAAYNSRASGAWEVYVAPLQRMVPQVRVSPAGGVQPLWRQDGGELFFLTPDGTVMCALVRSTAPPFHADPARPLFRTSLVPAEGWPQYAVTPDGQRFLVKEPIRQFFTLLQNWLPTAGPR